MPTPRKPAAKKAAPKPRKKAVLGPPLEELKPPSEEISEEARAAYLQSYSALKLAGLPVPEEIGSKVEGWIQEEQARRVVEQAEYAEYQEQLDEENKAGPWYVRNGYTGAPLSLRLERKGEIRRIELKPRGVPGDMHPLEEEDLNHIVIKRNCQIGVCEVIPAGQANRIAEQQTTNMTPRVHTPTAILRNEQGKPYEGNPVKMELEYNSLGVTAGIINPDQMQGGIEDKQIARDGGVTRPQQREVASQFIPTAGNPHIIENGPVQTPVQMGAADARAQAAYRELVNRKRSEGPGSVLEGMQVTVNPTQRS